MSIGDPISTDFALLPPDPGLINPDLALDAALAPVEDFAPDAPRPFGKGWDFDFLAGQFVRRGSAPQEAYDLDNLRVWCEKALRTAKYAHPIYSDTFGAEDPYSLIGQQQDDALLSGYQETISDALLTHDRIVGVEDFSFTHDPFEEEVYGNFTVILDATTPFEPQTVEFEAVPLTGS